MKTKTRRRRWLITSLLLWLAAMPLAQAFYDPSTGRWINRDPLGELGFEISMRNTSLAPHFADVVEDANLFRFIHNGTPNRIDSDGRAVPVAIAGYAGACICWRVIVAGVLMIGQAICSKKEELMECTFTGKENDYNEDQKQCWYNCNGAEYPARFPKGTKCPQKMNFARHPHF